MNPVYVPPELMNYLLPPPQSGLPFNAQLHKSDIERGYIVPTHYPQPLLADLESEVDNNPDLRAVKEAHEEFINVLKRSTVQVVIPTDSAILELIHNTIEYVIKEGPICEAMLIARESNNPNYRFLYDNKSNEHTYYRWKLFSMLNGSTICEWSTEEFRMFENGPLWRPPPPNPFADGMPQELIDRLDNPKANKNLIVEHSPKDFSKRSDKNRVKLDQIEREELCNLLKNIEPTKSQVGMSMMFCMDHAYAASEIIELIQESLQALDSPLNRQLARLFLISDILNNCSAAVTNASFYREGFQAKLVVIFEYLRKYLSNIADEREANSFKQKILNVLGAWKEWTLYENEFLVKLSNILLGMEFHDKVTPLSEIKLPDSGQPECDPGTDLDGVQIDERTLSRCLESKGLSLRWYMTLELSEDEDESEAANEADGKPPRLATGADGASGADSQVIKFKTSKWETLDPNEVAGQVVTISKWEAMARAEEEDGLTDSSTSSPTSPDAAQAVSCRQRGSIPISLEGDLHLVRRRASCSSEKMKLAEEHLP